MLALRRRAANNAPERDAGVPSQHPLYPSTRNVKPAGEDGLLLGLAIACVAMLAAMTAGVACTWTSLGLVVGGALFAGYATAFAVRWRS